MQDTTYSLLWGHGHASPSHAVNSNIGLHEEWSEVAQHWLHHTPPPFGRRGQEPERAKKANIGPGHANEMQVVPLMRKNLG